MNTSRVLKFPVKGNGEVTSITCRKHRLLDIQLQNHCLFCWIETRDDLPETTTELLSVGTGWDIPSEIMANAVYIKTVPDIFGYVWHFYEVTIRH